VTPDALRERARAFADAFVEFCRHDYGGDWWQDEAQTRNPNLNLYAWELGVFAAWRALAAELSRAFAASVATTNEGGEVRAALEALTHDLYEMNQMVRVCRVCREYAHADSGDAFPHRSWCNVSRAETAVNVWKLIVDSQRPSAPSVEDAKRIDPGLRYRRMGYGKACAHDGYTVAGCQDCAASVAPPEDYVRLPADVARNIRLMADRNIESGVGWTPEFKAVVEYARGLVKAMDAPPPTGADTAGLRAALDAARQHIKAVRVFCDGYGAGKDYAPGEPKSWKTKNDTVLAQIDAALAPPTPKESA
jgi:hypothetical protein